MTDKEKEQEEKTEEKTPTEPEKRVDEQWKKQAQAERQKVAKEPKRREKVPLPPPSFGVFINSLAVQALIALGEVENPVTKRRDRDLDQAKYTIDILGMIEEKTKGNLTDQERKLLDQVLYDIRMRYVNAVGV